MHFRANLLLLILILLSPCSSLYAQCATQAPINVVFQDTDPAPGFGLVSSENVKWPKSLLRVEFLGGTKEEREYIRYYALEWARKTSIDLLFHTRHKSDIRITFNKNLGSKSLVGKTASKPKYKGRWTMNFSVFEQGVVLHEFGHAIGYTHEHLRSDFNIQWNEKKVIADMKAKLGWEEQVTRHNILNPISVKEAITSVKDKNSIMMYEILPGWTYNNIVVPYPNKLSHLDISFTNKMYRYNKFDKTTCNNFGNKIEFDEFGASSLMQIRSWQHHCTTEKDYNYRGVATNIHGQMIWQQHRKGQNPTESMDVESWVQVGEKFLPQHGWVISLEPYGSNTKKTWVKRVSSSGYTETWRLELTQGDANLIKRFVYDSGKIVEPGDQYFSIGQGKFYR